MNETHISNLGRLGSAAEIQAISLDFELHFNKVTVLYVVDTFDIIEFCFPSLSLTNERLEDTIASSFLAYNFFFFRRAQKPFVLNEYKIELFSLWNEVYKEARLFTNKKVREKEIEQIRNSFKSDKDKILRKMGLLLGISLGLVTEDSLHRYKTILQEKLEVEKVSVDNADAAELNQLINETSYSNAAIDVFGKFCEEQKFVLSGKSSEEKYIYLENAYRDIVVYDRINNINAKIQASSSLSEKYVVLYLSSTPNKSAKIAKLYADAYIHTTIYGRANFPIHRNIAQFYLKELIAGSSTTAADVHAQLNQCREIIQQNKDRTALTKMLSSQLSGGIKAFNQKLDDNSIELENMYLLCKSFSSYKDRITKALQDSPEIFDEELKMVVSDLFSKIDSNEKANEKLKLTLDNFKGEFQVQNKILQFLRSGQRKYELYYMRPMPGSDSIRSYMQLYPVLLFYQNLPDQKYQQLFDFFRQIITPRSYRRGFSATAYMKLKQNDLFYLDSYEKRLYNLFLNLVVPNQDISREEMIKNEGQVTDSLIKLYHINKRRYLMFGTGNSVDSEVIDVFFYPQIPFELDVAYFLSWLYRRSRRYEEALELLNTTLEKYNRFEPRLLHSRALCIVSQIYEERFIRRSYLESRCLMAIGDLDAALEGFTKVPGYATSELLQHIIIGIKNTKCDLLVRLYASDPQLYEDRILQEARPLLDTFKRELYMIGESFNDYPTYNHTEVDLEHCEALIHFSKGNTIDAIEKIEYAERRLKMVMEHELLEDYEQLIATKSKIDELRQRLK